MNFKVFRTNYHIQIKSVATFKSKINASMPQNAWELLLKFKKISLIQKKRSNIFFGQNHAKTATVTGRVLLFGRICTTSDI